MHESPRSPLDISPDWRAGLQSDGWLTLEALFAIPNDASLAKPGLPSWRERLRCALHDPATGKSRNVFLKRFRRPPFSEQLRRCLTGDPNHGTAWTEWNWLRRLARADISAPAPIAYGESMRGPWERCSAVLMGAAGGVSLERLCRERPLRLPDAVQRAGADLVSRFHALNVAHRDLYLAHVFCDHPDAATPRFWLIDLQRVRPMGWRRRRWIVKDLASLNYSTPDAAANPGDRLRWLKRYLGVARLGRGHRVLARLILAKTERIRRHDRRMGRTAKVARA